MPGVGPREVGQRLRQQVLHHDEGRGQAQRTGQFAVAPQHPAFDLLGLVGHAPRLLQQQRARVGRFVPTSRAVEQTRAQAQLQRIQAALHGGGVHAQPPRRRSHRAPAARRPARSADHSNPASTSACLESLFELCKFADFSCNLHDCLHWRMDLHWLPNPSSRTMHSPATAPPPALRLLEKRAGGRVQPSAAPSPPLAWWARWLRRMAAVRR
jgi:hypothetical protein